MERDNEIFDIIDREHLRQRRGIEFIASENFVSDEVMRAMGSCLTNKYAEGYPGHRYYGGCQIVDEAETIAIERAKSFSELNGQTCSLIAEHRQTWRYSWRACNRATLSWAWISATADISAMAAPSIFPVCTSIPSVHSMRRYR